MKHLGLALSLTGGTAMVTQGASIGLNLGSGRANASLAPTDEAGVVPQQNWNNAPGAAGSLAILNSDSGSASGASVTWATDEQWSVGGTPVDANGILLNGFVSQNNSGNDSSILFTGIPFVAYDLYVYLSHDRGSEDVILSEGNLAFDPFTAVENDTAIGSVVTFTQQTMSGVGSGNYVRFANLTSPTLELRMSAVDLGPGTLDRNAISAVQIVQVPEPSAFLLSVLAGMGMIARRKR